MAEWAVLMLLVPPDHEYPVVDDWNHTASVRTMLDTGTFRMPPTMQANLAGLTVWGAAWARLFGFGFSTLTYSTIFLALVGLLAFYGIARAVDVPSWGALLGTGLLALNPLFVHLSYSFMTDVPFLSLTLIACYFYIRGIQSDKLAWLLLGGAFAAWAFTIRQFGLLVPVAFVLYLGFAGVITRKWHWRQMLALAAIPVLTIAAWWLWRHDIPPTVGALAASSRARQIILKEPWLRVTLIRSLTLLPVAALSAWAALKMRRSQWWLVPVWSVVIFLGLSTLDLPNEGWIQMYEPPFAAQFGLITVNFPQEVFTFGGWGNIVRIVGIDFFEYQQQPVWSPEAWRGLWALGMGLGALLLARITGSLYDWLSDTWRQRRTSSTISPIAAFYLLGGMIFVISMAFLGDIYDRYMFHFLPFVILFVVSGSKAWGRIAWTYSVVTLVLISSFTVLAKSDNMEHGNTRWQAAQWLQARTGGLHAGYDWDNWVCCRNDNYHITDIHADGYRTERSFPYFSRLGGFTTRYVLAESRSDMPPLLGGR